MAQSERGRIEIFEDFIGGVEYPVADSHTAPLVFPPYFQLVTNDGADSDAGIVCMDADGLNGVVQLIATDEADKTMGLQTATMWDVGKMGTIVAEARLRLPDFDELSILFGFTDVVTDAAILQSTVVTGATDTLTLSASDVCCFFLASELDEDEMWHGVYKGGTATGETTSANVELVDAVADEFDILRVEIDNNGTARWFVNGVLLQTVAGAVSTTTDLSCQLIIEQKGTSSTASVEVDYIHITGNRDWTV